MDMKRLWRACLVLMAAVCIGLGGQGPAEAAPQVIEATGVYIMGDNDSPKIARDAARQEAMRAAPRQYLNRLSDLLFVLARVLNRVDGGDDVYWKSERLAQMQDDGA